MALKSYRPYTPGMRFKTTLVFDDITTNVPYKPLTKSKAATSGRGAGGRISVWCKGGAGKRKIRVIDFKRDKHGMAAKVVSIEYDPNRSANIALLQYADGERRYIIAPNQLKVGMSVMSGPNATPSVGNCLPLYAVPLGANIHAIELQKGKGAQLARSAGVYGTLVAKEGDYVTIRLPSGEMRMIFNKCIATLGVVGNEDHMNITLGNAGRSRHLGRRPHVRGIAMNPIDHPHGGGEGKTAAGRHPVTPWGQPTKGYKTRDKRKVSSRFIVKRRK